MKQENFTSEKIPASLDEVSLNHFAHDGIKREYLKYIPPGYSHINEAAVVLNFHGFGGTASGQLALSDWRDLAVKHDIILI